MEKQAGSCTEPTKHWTSTSTSTRFFLVEKPYQTASTSQTGDSYKPKPTAVTWSHVHALISLFTLLSFSCMLVCVAHVRHTRPPHMLDRLFIFAWNWRGGNGPQWETWFLSCSHQHAKCRYGKENMMHWGMELVWGMYFVFLWKCVCGEFPLTCYLSVPVWFSIITWLIFAMHVCLTLNYDLAHTDPNAYIHTWYLVIIFLSLSPPSCCLSYSHTHFAFTLTCTHTHRENEQQRPNTFPAADGSCKLGWEIIIGSLNMAAILIRFM